MGRGRDLGAGAAAAAAATVAAAADEFPHPIQAPSPRRAGIEYPVRVTPHSDN